MYGYAYRQYHSLKRQVRIIEDIGAKYYEEYLAGDDDAVEKLIETYYPGLTLYIKGITGDYDMAEDIAQDTFVKLVTKQPRFSGKSSFKTWLYSIAGNIAKDYLKAERRRKTQSLDDAKDQPALDDIELTIIQNEQYSQLYKGLLQLKPEYRQALWLTYFEGLTIKEVAKIMKRSEGSVSALISRGKFALSPHITENSDNNGKGEKN